MRKPQRTPRSIWITEWIVEQQKTKKQVLRYTAKNVGVVGMDVLRVSKNPIFVGRVYREVFKKDKWKKELEKGSLRVIKISYKTYHGESFAPDGDKVFE